jgi:WD40 repeat protein
MRVRWRRWLKWPGLAAWLAANAVVILLLPSGPRFVLPTAKCSGLAYSADGRRLFTCDEQGLREWDLNGGRETWSMPRPDSLPPNGSALTPDGRLRSARIPSVENRWLLIDGTCGTALLIRHPLDDVPSGSPRARVLAAESGQVEQEEGIDLARDGHTMAAAARDGVVVWDLVTGAERSKLPHSYWALAFAPDGRTLAVVERDGPQIVLWDVEIGRPRSTLPRGGDRNVRRLRFSPDGRYLLGSAGMAGLVQDTGGTACFLWDLREERIIGQWDRPWLMAWTADGQLLDAGVATSGALAVTTRAVPGTEANGHWTAPLPKDVRRVGYSGWYHLTASANGRVVAATVNLSPPDWAVWVARWLPNALGRRLTASWAETHLWDAQTGKLLAVVETLNSFVAALAPNGRSFAAVDREGWVLVWDVPLARPWGQLLAIWAGQAVVVGIVVAWRIRRRKVR